MYNCHKTHDSQEQCGALFKEPNSEEQNENFNYASVVGMCFYLSKTISLIYLCQLSSMIVLIFVLSVFIKNIGIIPGDTLRNRASKE